MFRHDYTYCADWHEDLCPPECFRAQITKELFDEPAEVQKNLLISWANLYGSDECLIRKGKWEECEQTEEYGLLRCSVCHNCYIHKDYLEENKWHWCPQCGARMIWEDEEEAE